MTHLDEANRKALGITTNRRQFLAGSGTLVVSFSWAASTMPTFAEDVATAKTVATDEVDAFLTIDGKGAVTVYSGKVDLGTGVRTAMTQIVAEELGPMAHISCFLALLTLFEVADAQSLIRPAISNIGFSRLRTTQRTQRAMPSTRFQHTPSGRRAHQFLQRPPCFLALALPRLFGGGYACCCQGCRKPSFS
jgi:hypothetical protein